MVHRVTVAWMPGRLLALIASLAAAAGCYRAPEPDCGFSCGPGGLCPADYSCAAGNVCRRNGAPGEACRGAPDARIDSAPADAYPPVHLVSVSPVDMATGVPVVVTVIATVDEDVVGYDTTSFSVGGLGIENPATVEFDSATKELRFIPLFQFSPNTMYTAAITGAITNIAGFPLGPHSWTFMTGDDTIAPHVWSTTPQDTSTQVPTDTTIRVQFDEAVTGVDLTSYTVTDGAAAVTGTITSSAQQDYTFHPAAALSAGSTITVSLSSAIQDLSGNAFAPMTFSFTTAP